MKIQFRQSFYLQSLHLCTSVADNVFKNLRAVISVEPVQKNAAPTTKSCNGSTLRPSKKCYKHNTEHNRLKWIFTFANSDISPT